MSPQPEEKAFREQKSASALCGVSEKPALPAGKDLARLLVGEKIASDRAIGQRTKKVRINSEMQDVSELRMIVDRD
jgi:hypothetical protein